MSGGVTALLQELIRIPSVNPDGGPLTDQTGEGRMAAFLADHLRQLGAEVELREVLPDRPNVLARFPADRPGKPKLLFAPHTDTVSVAGMTVDPFAAEIRDGCIFGRGASDTKGSIAAMLHALESCRDRLDTLSHEIWFAGLMGEETGLLGSEALAKQESFDFVIAGEPTGLDVVHTTKGSAWITVRTHGIAAHGSRPEAGRNAIYAMADIIRTVRDEIIPGLSGLSDPILGNPTINVGTISGGSKTNIVPHACEITLDARTIPGQSLDPILARLRETAPDADVTVWSNEPLATDPNHPLIETFVNLGSRRTGAPWFCDAAHFASAGTPAIALGPGSIDQAHTKDEFIRVADLEAGAEFFARFLRALARQ